MELAHCRAIRIVFLVPREHSIPAACDAATPRKRQFRRMPIALQKGINIGMIPRGLLSSEDRANGFPISYTLTGRLRLCRSLRGHREKTEQRTSHQKPSAPASDTEAPMIAMGYEWILQSTGTCQALFHPFEARLVPLFA